MTEYRTFLNSDPPHIAALWNSAGLGRGAAGDCTVDTFESLIFAQPYFDPKGLIVATDGQRRVGFALASFPCRTDETGLRNDVGVICGVIVHPDYRRQGIARELLRRAEEYLLAAGVETLEAGPAGHLGPFHFGLYGGSEPAGFLESDTAAKPFFEAQGYREERRHLVFQRVLGTQPNPMSFRLVTICRKTELTVTDQPEHLSWWWVTRHGRIDSLRFHLTPKSGDAPLASATVIGLDYYLPKWRERSVGLMDLEVPEARRGSGYGQALLVEIGRRVAREMVTRIEAHALDTNEGAIGVLRSAGFSQVDTGIVYSKPVVHP